MNWQISKDAPNAPKGFPFVIIKGKEVIAWVKNEQDAEFIAHAPSKIEDLEAERSDYESRWLSALASHSGG